MNNILIPTDFSVCAEQATLVAGQLALRFGAKLHFLHLIESRRPWFGAREEETSADDATERLDALCERFSDIRTAASSARGEALQELIRAYVHQHGIDLVVMGSHGASGKSEYFIGSNTQRVVRTLRCPVLIVKEAPEEVSFDRVVFASNFNEGEKEAFLRFKDFVKPFLPEIHLVVISTSSLFDPPYVVTREILEDFRALSHPYACKVHIFKDFTVERGIRSFSEGIGAKLIGISNHHRHPIRRMLMGSNVETLINHAHIPVLSIDYEEKEEETGAA